MATNGTSALRRARTRVRTLPALAFAMLVVAVCVPGLTLTHHTGRLALPRARAIAAATGDPTSKRIMAGAHWTRVSVTTIDASLDRVSFYDGAQIVGESAVNTHGQVVRAADYRRAQVPYGNWLAYEPGVIVALAALFVLVAGVAPLRRIRNLDVAAALTLLAPILLLQRRYVDASVIAAVPGLAYLMARCAWLALRPAQTDSSAVSRPLLNALTPGLDAVRRVRLLRLLLAALALTTAMVGISSTNQVDVIFAVMEGATRLIHGVLPYGHMPGDIIHGDTYPVLSYVLYAPLALASPVNSLWDSVDIALAATVAAALASAWALLRACAGPRRIGGAPRPPEAEEAGLRAALAWLSFPAVLIVVSTGTTDVLLGTMLLAAVLLWRRPALSGGLLAVAAWFKFAPIVLLPVWLAPLRGRRLLAAVAAMGLVSAAMVALLLGFGGVQGVRAMIHAISYQFSRGSEQSPWAALGIEWLHPVGQACLLGLVAGAALRLRRDPDLAADRSRLGALSAAILIGLQLSADYWAFLYLVWVLPLMCVSLLESRALSPVGATATADPGPSSLQPVYVQ